jgi:hypothetical protein
MSQEVEVFLRIEPTRICQCFAETPLRTVMVTWSHDRKTIALELDPDFSFSWMISFLGNKMGRIRVVVRKNGQDVYEVPSITYGLSQGCYFLPPGRKKSCHKMITSKLAPKYPQS